MVEHWAAFVPTAEGHTLAAYARIAQELIVCGFDLPLELLVRICDAVQNWLAADAESVAVLHCRTGRRRTCTVIACLMAWLGEAASPVEALQIVAQRRGVPISALTIPSQRRACSSGRAPLTLSM